MTRSEVTGVMMPAAVGHDRDPKAGRRRHRDLNVPGAQGEATLNWADTCTICGTGRGGAELVVWFVGGERRVVHSDCWIAVYERDVSTRLKPADRWRAPSAYRLAAGTD
jgi:hypothetical protein